MVSTPLKNISQNGNLPQIGVKIKNIWNYHPGGSIVLSHQWCEAGMSFKICHSEVWISEPNTTKLSPFCTSFLHFWLSQIGSTRLFRSYPKTKCHRNLTNIIVKSRKLAASLLAQNPTLHTFSYFFHPAWHHTHLLRVGNALCLAFCGMRHARKHRQTQWEKLFPPEKPKITWSRKIQ